MLARLAIGRQACATTLARWPVAIPQPPATTLSARSCKALHTACVLPASSSCMKDLHGHRKMSTVEAITGRVQPILELGNPRLRIKCPEVAEERFGSQELHQLVEDMIATMRHANGAGIAANQIGVLDRVYVCHGTGANPRYPYKPKIPLTVFVNPIIEPLNEEKIDLIEGCLSVPGFRGQVQRSAVVRVHARRPDGSSFSILARGHAAGTMQHECDHLDGVLFPDLAMKNAAPRFSGDVLMTSAAFEAHFKTQFFEHAEAINQSYPVPLEC